MSNAVSRNIRLALLTCSVVSLTACGWFQSSDTPAGQTQLNNYTTSSADDNAPGLKLYDALAQGLKANPVARPGHVVPGSFVRLDQGIGYIQDNAGIAKTRADRTANLVAQQIRSAYLRGRGAAAIESDMKAWVDYTNALQPQSEEDQKKLQAALGNLNRLYKHLDDGRDDLAVLLNQDRKNLDLAAADLAINTHPVTAKLEDLEILALTSRPEMMGKQSDPRAMRDKALQAFPGISELLTRSTDGNTALNEAQWEKFSNNFTDGIIRIFAKPVSLEQAENRAMLDSLREYALSAAIMAQVHIAYEHYQSAVEALVTAQHEIDIVTADKAQRDVIDNAVHSLEILSAHAKTRMAQAEMDVAYVNLLNAIGTESLPDNAGQMNVVQLSKAIRDRFESPITSPQATLTQIQQKTEEHSGFQRVNFTIPAKHARIPLTEKLSSKTVDTPLAMNQTQLLHVSKRQVQNLLEAPISEP